MTTTPLTDQQLAEIAARAEAATEGPWGYFDGDNYAALAADYQQTGRGSYTCRQGIARLEEDDFWDDQANEGRDEGDAYEQMIANAEFITHARTDVPALLAELGRVRAELATVLAAVDRTTVRMREYSEAGSGGVNPRQVINLLSLTWPDGNFEAPPAAVVPSA